MDAELRAGVVRRFIQVAVSLVIQAIVLFASSGRLDWGWAWTFLGLSAAGIAINAPLLLKRSPETIAARASLRGMKT